MFLCSTFTLTVGVFWYWNIYLYPPSQPISNILSFSVGNLIRVHVAYITNIDGQFIVTIKIINTVPQNHRNTESQKHNGWGWKAPLEDILYSLSDKAGSPTGSCPAERLHSSSGNLCKCFTVEKCLLILDGIFCVSICAPFVLSWGTTERSLALFSLHPPSRYLHAMNKSLWAFSRLNSPCSLSLSPQEFLQPPNHLCDPFFGLTPVARKWTQYSRCSLTSDE